MSFSSHPNSPWNANSEELLKDVIAWWNEGLSAGSIVNEIFAKYRITVSRNAVIGKLARSGVTKRKQHPNMQPAARRVGASHKSVKVIKNNVALLAAAEVPELPITLLDAATNVDLMGLEKGMCKWPVGDDLYCGAVVFATRHSSYCALHARLSADPLRAKRYEEGRDKRMRRYY